MDTTRIGKKELRNTLSHICLEVEEGMVPYVVVTDNRRPVAAIVPVDPDGMPYIPPPGKERTNEAVSPAEGFIAEWGAGAPREDHQSVVDEWNRDHEPGTEVSVTSDSGEVIFGKTKSAAWLLRDGTPVVGIAGRDGGYGYLLSRVSPIGGPGGGEGEDQPTKGG